ncbi:hypothetical protein [Allokutzneria oryzae]|uniref:NACHT domain-containing protein n=1 Tax=Allokutzneria oryzae TaxID=1378989 RepID=A0ABV6A500_9PSEU
MDKDGWSGTANQIDGTVYGPAVQANSIHGDVHITVTSGGDGERPVPCAPPSGWHDRPELPDAVRFLLRAEIQTAHELPYRLPGARRPSLATVYVRQDLGSGSEEDQPEQPQPTPILDGRGQVTDPPNRPVTRVAVRPPSRTVREALDTDDHLLITGGPGQGKSTLSLRLAADVAARWLSSDAEGAPIAEPVVPLRVTARELACRLGLPFSEALAESTRIEYGALLGAFLDARLLSERIAGCRWLLLVDGLDEVADSAERDRLVTVLAAWSSDAGSPYRVVLTTRPLEGATLAPLQRIGAARYELQPFGEEALWHFAHNWFDDDDQAHRFVRQIHAAYLDDLVRVPLLATIAAIIFEQHSDRPLPDNQYELYETYLKYLRSGRPTASVAFDQVCDALLEHLGRIRLEDDTSLVAAALDWTAQHLPDLAGDWQDDLITYLATVGPLSRRGDDLRFLHHSFAEHLAATERARLLPGSFEPDHPEFARLLHAARPSERGRHARAVLLHHTRLHPTEADHLIGWLHSGGADQHLLAARLLALHVPAGPDVVDAFLDTVRAWAMTTQYPGGEILAQADRAAHHPGMATWLVGLMRDEDAPWDTRIEAATALATRLRGAESPDATAQLRAVVDDMTVPVEHRLTAAEALCECGSSEREASEHGLRLVLADPSATGLECRTAAVVLAGFDGAARAFAVEALMSMLDDPWTPDYERVEAATGLVEIGVEFHERCAEVFRVILGNRTVFDIAMRNAAMGLASLGPHELTEAVANLTALANDRRLDCSDRISAVEALAELGPQHRVTAGEQLVALSEEFGREPGDLWRVASSLAQLGFDDHALALLRAVLANLETGAHDQLWAARTLANVAPDHQDEAVGHLRRVTTHPMMSAGNRAAALAQLVIAGEPHRTPALASMRAVLSDPVADPALRCHVGAELKELGPEFHGEVARHALGIATGQADPDARRLAWRTLRSLGTKFSAQASSALSALMGPDEAANWEAHRDYAFLMAGDVDDHSAAAEVLTAAVHDPARSVAVQVAAACSLVNLGPRFHRTALSGVIGLLRARLVPVTQLSWIARTFAELGSEPRAELAEAFRELARCPETDAATVATVAEVLEHLSHRADPEIIAALRDVVADDLVEAQVRGDAGIALVRAVPDALGEVAAVVLEDRDDESVLRWERHVRKLAALGTDVAPKLRDLVSDVDATRRRREVAAGVLADLGPGRRDEALDELRAQADDEFLEFQWRTDPMMRLARLDPATLGDAIDYHRAVLDDEREPIAHRCEAALQLVRLDQSFGDAARAALQRFATSPEFTINERAVSVVWFAMTGPYRALEVNRLGLAVARDPAADATMRSRLANEMFGSARLEVERSLLTDRSGSPGERVSGLDTWESRALATEAEAALRDVLTAVESLPAQRIQAAAALGGLSPHHVPEAVNLLEQLSTGACAADARAELAKLDQRWRRRLLAEDERLVADTSRSWRQRCEASGRIWSMNPNPGAEQADFLRELVGDERLADDDRVRILYALRWLDGLKRLREIRDDERTPPATRRAAANQLRDHAVEDRVAGARTLHAIASDTTCRPALRWRAANDLTRFGVRGREIGVSSLQAIAADDTLPVIGRVDAARALGDARPDLRGEVLRFLRPLSTTGKPLARIQVLEAIGQFDATGGARALREMAWDRTLGPGVRLRAASSMSKLCRDYREAAAGVAREVAHDKAAPRHIRVKAARALARWTELCRAEAQDLLVGLDSAWC